MFVGADVLQKAEGRIETPSGRAFSIPPGSKSGARVQGLSRNLGDLLPSLSAKSSVLVQR